MERIKGSIVALITPFTETGAVNYNKLGELLDFHIENVESKGKGGKNVYTNIYTLHLPSALNYTDVINYLASYPNIMVVRATNT